RAISSWLSEASGEGARAVPSDDTAAVLCDGIELDALCVGKVPSPSRRKGCFFVAGRGNTGPDPGGIKRCGRFRVDVLADEPSANVLLPADERALAPSAAPANLLACCCSLRRSERLPALSTGLADLSGAGTAAVLCVGSVAFLSPEAAGF